MSHILGAPAVVSNTGKTSPLAKLEDDGTNSRAVESLDYILESVYVFVFTWKH